MVKGGNLVDFSRGKAHLVRQRHDVRCGQAAVAILDLVQMLDQKIAAPGLAAQERLHFRERARLNCAALRPAARLTVSLFSYDAAFQPPSSHTVLVYPRLSSRASAPISAVFPSPRDCGSP
jgi:hypothetical protein